MSDSNTLVLCLENAHFDYFEPGALPDAIKSRVEGKIEGGFEIRSLLGFRCFLLESSAGLPRRFSDPPAIG